MNPIIGRVILSIGLTLLLLSTLGAFFIVLAAPVNFTFIFFANWFILNPISWFIYLIISLGLWVVKRTKDNVNS